MVCALTPLRILILPLCKPIVEVVPEGKTGVKVVPLYKPSVEVVPEGKTGVKVVPL